MREIIIIIIIREAHIMADKCADCGHAREWHGTKCVVYIIPLGGPHRRCNCRAYREEAAE